MFSLVYGLYPENLTVPVSSVYAALGHTAWSIGVSFIVIQCCTGSASMIDSFLSLRLMYPLSRLTYCAYLVHPVIMMITVTQMDGPLHLHNSLVVRRLLCSNERGSQRGKEPRKFESVKPKWAPLAYNARPTFARFSSKEGTQRSRFFAFQADPVLWQSGRLLFDVLLHFHRARGARGQSAQDRFHLEEEDKVEKGRT